MQAHDLTLLFLAVAVLLASARIAAEVAQRLRQPAVLGEIIAGIVLGPTIFGAIAPGLQSSIFPATGPLAAALQGLTTLAIALFLLVAGMEIEVATVWRQGKSVVVVAAVGVVVPFAFGFVPAYAAPAWFGASEKAEPLVFALFFATAMAITALPVIAKILRDLNLFQTEIGVTILSAAILNDLVGWIIFAFVLTMMGAAPSGFSPEATAVLTILFTLFMFTIGRWGVNRVLPWVQANTDWPGGVLGFALASTMLCAAFTEWIGVHAIFGAFLFGVALGDSAHLRRRTRATIDHFVSFVFAPLFFASIGLRVDFVENFDLLLVLAVLVIASAGKIIGCTMAARWMKFGRDEARAIGFGMNARGAMEIVLGLLALQAGIIGDELFVALVIMALVTSMASGVLIERSFGRKRPGSLLDLLSAKTFLPAIDADDRFGAISQLSAIAAEARGLDPAATTAAVLARERVFGSGMGHGVAIPHARLDALQGTVVAVGLSRRGIDFDARDGKPVHVVAVILTGAEEAARHVEILAQIARAFEEPDVAKRMASRVTSLTELRAFLRIETAEGRAQGG